MAWEIVVGIETHAQLLTKSKMFSGASTAFGAAPNSQTSAVDIALPGALPVVNAAAVEFETVPLHLTTDDDFEKMMQINVSALFRCMRAEINVMLETGSGGSIVNIASSSSFRPQAQQPAYTASKHAVLGLTRSAALDYAAAGIRVNAICPGTIDTPMLRSAIERRGRNPEEVAKRLSRFGRFGTPQEIADACLWLCSGASSFTTGHALAVDGGMLGS